MPVAGPAHSPRSPPPTQTGRAAGCARVATTLGVLASTSACTYLLNTPPGEEYRTLDDGARRDQCTDNYRAVAADYALSALWGVGTLATVGLMADAGARGSGGEGQAAAWVALLAGATMTTLHFVSGQSNEVPQCRRVARDRTPRPTDGPVEPYPLDGWRSDPPPELVGGPTDAGASRPRIVVGLRTAFMTNAGPDEDVSPIGGAGLDLEVARLGPVTLGASFYDGVLLGEPAGGDDWEEVHRFEDEMSGVSGAVRLGFEPQPRGVDESGYGALWRVAFNGNRVALEGDISLLFGTSEVWGDIGYAIVPTWEETRLAHLDIAWRDSAFGTARIGLALWMLTAKGNLGLSSSFVFDLGREWGVGVRAEGGHQGWLMLGLWLERRIDP